MKKIVINTAIAAGLAAALTGCAAGENGSLGIGQSVAASMLNNQCHSYANGQQLWKAAKLALGSQAQVYEDKICSCASTEASRNMTTQQMISLANENTRTQTLTDLIVPTFSTCYRQLVN